MGAQGLTDRRAGLAAPATGLSRSRAASARTAPNAGPKIQKHGAPPQREAIRAAQPSVGTSPT